MCCGADLLMLLLLFGLGIFIVIPFWRIFQKAGFSGWWSLTQIIPIVNILTLFFFANKEWPTLSHSK